MNAIPKKRKHPKMGVRLPTGIVSPGHLKFCRSHECSISGQKDHVCVGKIEAHHVHTQGSGGGDEQVAPLCTLAHKLVHDMGRMTFCAHYNVNLTLIAAKLWDADQYHRLKHSQSQSRIGK